MIDGTHDQELNVNIHNTRTHRSSVTTWLLAVLIPLGAAVAGWFWSDATVSARNCQTGASGEGVANAGIFLLVLVLAGPIAVGWHAARTRQSLARILAPTFTSLLMSVVLVFMALQLWWYQHNCYT